MPYKDTKRGKANKAYRNKEYIRQCKELGKCLVCGESRTVCLVYHHRDPLNKLFEIGMSGGRSLEVIYQEIKKCDLVCANCHCVIHAEVTLLKAIKDDKMPLFEGVG